MCLCMKIGLSRVNNSLSPHIPKEKFELPADFIRHISAMSRLNKIERSCFSNNNVSLCLKWILSSENLP